MDAGRNAPVRVRLKLKMELRQVAHAVLQVPFKLVGSSLNLNLIPYHREYHFHFQGLGNMGWVVRVYGVEVGFFLCGSSYGSSGGSMVWVLLWVFGWV